MPVTIHVSDPVAFFTPTDGFNERYEELNNHPDWSLYSGDFPGNAELLEACNRVPLSFGRAVCCSSIFSLSVEVFIIWTKDNKTI